MGQQELIELFHKLGASDPESCAGLPATERLSQLARYLFLRQAWRKVVSPNDHSWIAKMQQLKPDGPGGGVNPAIARLLAAGGQVEDLTTVVRVMQWWLLAGICVLLDQPGDVEPELADMQWQLFLLDQNDAPLIPIDALIESLLETDPTGREMRP